MTRIELDTVPSLVRGYGRALFTRKPGLTDGATVPAIEVHLPGARINPDQLRGYCEVCGFAATEPVPITFPQILATSVAIELVLSRDFPCSPLGIVHIGSTLTERRALTSDDTLDVTCRIEGHRDARQGKLMSLETNIEVGGALVWQSANEFLVRSGKPAKGKRRARTPESAPEGARVEVWDVPASQGRKYARVSGDYNPIHLSALSAKLFGFRRAIAHGLWTLARSVAAVGDLPAHPYRVEAEFKRPLFLPARVRFACVREEPDISWDVRSEDGSVPHLIGRVRPE